MSKPRIVILHYTAPPIVGGVEQMIVQHARLLLDAGYPVTIVTGRGGDIDAFARAKVILVPEIDSKDQQNVDIARAVRQGDVPSMFGSLQQRIEDLLAPACRDSDVFIAHNVFNFHFSLPLVAALHRLLDRRAIRRMIAWCHDVSRYVNPHSGEELRWGFPWDLLRTFRSEVMYVTVSGQRQRALAEILGCPPEQIRIIPNGVDARTLLGLSDLGQHLAQGFDLFAADLVLLMPIRITHAKNIAFALRVAAALKASGLRLKLIVTGPPDPHMPGIETYVDELLGLRRELGLDAEVVFVCEGTSTLPRPLTIDQTSVAELYRLADAVLLPSHREGFGLPVLEAGIVDKPVFCTDIPVLEAVGSETVYRIERDESPEQVAQRIRAWAEQDRAQRLRRRVRQEYTWQAIFRRAIEPLIADLTATGETKL